MTQVITILEKYREMVPPLGEKEKEALKSDIQKNGLHYPGIINKDGVLLDGHHRYDACKELGLEFPCTTKYFNDDLDEAEFVISINLLRRHLNTYQRTVLAINLEKIESERIKISEANRKSTSSDLNESPKQPERAADIAAKKVHLKPTTYFYGKTIINEGSEKLKKAFKENRITPDKGYSIIVHEKRREDARKEAIATDWKLTAGTDQWQIMEGDILEQGKTIGDETVDLIFTDPPYLSDTLDTYGKLAQLAERVLKPGGSLATIIGHHYLFDIHEYIRKNSNLKYQWMIVLRHGGHARRVHAYGVWAHYKPILWYFKGEKPTMYHDVSDLVESEPVDKSLHKWEQSTVEAKNLIYSLTVERNLVVDPFMGSGTTGQAAVEMNRRFRGIEINPEYCAIAHKRLTESQPLEPYIPKKDFILFND